MNFLQFLPLLGGAQGTEGGATGGGGIMSFLPFILIIGVFYFLIIRPQNKKQKETQKMLSALKKGDKIVTVGGVHGTISSVKEQTVVVKVDDNVKMEFSRSAISTVVRDPNKEEEKPAKEEDKSAIEDKSEGKENSDKTEESGKEENK
jgi:preprotein translocase subunit YajC